MPRKRNTTMRTDGSDKIGIKSTVNTFDILKVDDDPEYSFEENNSPHEPTATDSQNTLDQETVLPPAENISEDSDDGFTIVKPRRQRANKHNNVDDNDGSNDGSNDGWTKVTKTKKRTNRNNDYGNTLRDRPNRNYNKTERFERPEQERRVFKTNHQDTNDKDPSVSGSKYTYSGPMRTGDRKKPYNNDHSDSHDREDRANRYNRYNKRGDNFDRDDDKEYTDATYYNPDPDTENKGDNLSLNTPWKIWIHANDSRDWGLDSYNSGPKISTVGQMFRTLFDFESLNKRDFQYFVMRNEIAPIWEDINNKDGVITSIKINLGNRDPSYDIGAMAFKVICILVLNESFVKNNLDINGVCFSIKNNSPLIKIWVKESSRNSSFEKELPMALLRQIESMVESNRSRYNNYYRSGSSSRPVSVMTKNIEPDE